MTNTSGIFSAFPEPFHVFQLHRETFEIPCRGHLLAYGKNVRNQAFTHRNALGLQFHLEMTDTIIREWLKNLCKHKTVCNNKGYFPVSFGEQPALPDGC